ncbi:hypothetical protein ACFE04_025474 [Oxalis oulophora]
MEETLTSTTGKVIRCKAAVCRSPGAPLVIQEIEVDPPKAYELRLKILCSSLCHTDITFWKLSQGPMAVFQESSVMNQSESVGEKVEQMKQGDVVLPVFMPNCGECRDCKSPKSNTCSKFDFRTINMPRDNTSRFKDMNGEVIHHFIAVSSFTEYTVVDEAHLVKIGPHIPIDKACLLSCGVSTGVGAAWKVANVEEGSTVAIFGLGAVGLAVAEGARVRGASRIIGVDLNPAKFELGKKYGVSDFINPATCGEKSVSQVIKEMTDGGADYCFECIGLSSLVTEAFDSTREGWGKTVMLGVEQHGNPVSVNCYDIMRGRSVIGSLFGGCKPKSDIPIFADKYLNKELNLDGFVTHQNPPPMADAQVAKTLSEDYLLKGGGNEPKPEIVTKPVDVPVETPAEEPSSDEVVVVTQNADETPVSPVEESTETLAAAAEESSEAPAADSDDSSTPAATEESAEAPQEEKLVDLEDVEDEPDIKLETAPADFRFPTTNQTRHCFTRYIEFHRCVAAKGEGAPECDKFAKYYRSLCPGEWVDRWNEQRENGTFPGPL